MSIKNKKTLVLVIVAVTLSIIFITAAFFAAGLRAFKSATVADFSSGGVRAVYQVSGEDVEELDPLMFTASKLMLKTRLSIRGIINTKIQSNPDKRTIDVWIPLGSDRTIDSLSRILNDIIEPHVFTIQLIDESKTDDSGSYIPTGSIIIGNADVKGVKVLKRKDKYELNVSLGKDGAVKFEAATEKYIGRRLGIFVDNELINAPVVEAEITGGSFVITNIRTKDAAQDLADAIRDIPLMGRYEIVTIQKVSPAGRN